MSRKTILTIFAVLATIVTALGLSTNAVAAVGGLGAVAVYVLFEAKADIAAVRLQSAKWKDPKFWITVVSAVLATLASEGVQLPIDSNLIVGILTAIVAVLFKAAPSTRPA